jgi:putative ABC transport system substrate-binding protein
MKKAGLSSILIAVVLLALGVTAEAQQPRKAPRIGFLSAVDAARESTRFELFRLALRELGYIEGQNIAIEYRDAEGKQDRAPELAAELVRLKVDIIVVSAGDIWWAPGPTLSRQAMWKALPGPVATSPALQTLPEN